MSQVNLYNLIRPNRIIDMAPTCRGLPGLDKLVQSRNVPKVILLHGESGCGKTTTSRIIAMSLNCESKDKIPCGECDNCKFTKAAWEKGIEYGTVIYINAGKEGGVNEMRRIVERVQRGSLTTTNKVAIMVEECQEITDKSKNLLLDPTENVPEGIHWIFTTTEPSTLPIPFLRRCNQYQFSSLPMKSAIELIKLAYNKSTTKELDDATAENIIGGDTRPGFFIKTLEQYLESGEDINNLERIAVTSGDLENPKEVGDRLCKNVLCLIDLWRHTEDPAALLEQVAKDIATREITNYTTIRLRLVNTIKTMICKKLQSDNPTERGNIRPRLPVYGRIIRLLTKEGVPHHVMSNIQEAEFFADIIEAVGLYIQGAV